MAFDPNNPNDSQSGESVIQPTKAFDPNVDGAFDPNVDGNNGGGLGMAVLGTGVEVAGTILGGLAGAALMGAPSFGAGAPAGAIAGASAGAAMGAGAANYIKQLMEIHTGDRKEVKGGEIAASAAIGAIPAAWGAKAVAASTGVLKPILIRGSQGALSGAVASVAEKEIDEGRLPTWEEFGKTVIPAAVLGGAIGGVEKRYAMAGRLIANPIVAKSAQAATGIGVAAYVYNDAIEKGEENPLLKSLTYGAASIGATHIPSLIAKIDKEKAQRIILGPERTMGRGAVKVVEDYNNAVKAFTNYATTAGNDLSEAIEKQVGITPSIIADVTSVIDGKASFANLPVEIKAHVKDFIDQRAENTQKLKIYLRETGALTPELEKALDQGEQSYFRTAYAAHDPRAVKGVDYATKASSKKYRDELIKQSVSTGSTLSEAEHLADVKMSRMINDVGYMFSAAEQGGAKGTSPTSGLMKKGSLSDAAREYLGEVTEVGARVRATLNTQSKLILQEERDKALEAVMTKMGILSDVSKGANDTLIHTAEDPILHRRLVNKYAPREFVEAFKEMSSPNLFGDGPIAKAYMSVAGFSKAMKTVGNLPEAIMPQVLGNLMMAASSFKLNPADIVQSAKKAAQAHSIGTGKWDAAAKISFRKELRELQSLGIMSGSAEMNELTSFVSQSMAGGSSKGVLDKLSKTYGFPDAVVRYSMYKQNLEEVLSFGVGVYKNKPQAMKMAADITNQHFPTYERIPRRLRQLSAAGIANVFGGFEFEVMRNVTNQAKYAGQLLFEGQRTGNQAMSKAGAKRMLGLIGVGAATTATAYWGSRLAGTTEEDQKALNNVAVPQYDADKANFMRLGENGKFSYVPINYIMPYANMAGALTAAFTGENPLPYAKSTLLGNDFGPIITGGVEALTNTYYGTKVAITEPRDNQKLIERFAERAFMPQMISGTMTRVEKAIKGETNKLGSSPTLEDAALRIGGMRQTTMDILGGASTRIRSISDPMAGELTGYHRILNKSIQRGDTSFSQINEPALYKERSTNYERSQQDLHKVFMDLQYLGKRTGSFGDKEIIETFRKAGVPNAVIAGAALGFTVPMNRGLNESNTQVIEKILAKEDGRQNIYQEISIHAAGDYRKKEQLLKTYRDIRKNEARGGDAITKLFGGMSVSDGTRSKNIYAAMSAQPELADALRKKLHSTRVLTPDVARQIKTIAQQQP